MAYPTATFETPSGCQAILETALLMSFSSLEWDQTRNLWLDLLEKTKSLGVEFLNMVLGGLALKILLENIDDVVGFDAFLSLVSELLDGLGVLRLLDLPLDLFLDDILICEVDARGPTTLGMGLVLGLGTDPLCVDLRRR